MKTRYRRQPLAAATTLFLMALATPVAAQSVWTGAVDSDWSKDGNWDGGAVPPNGDQDILIDAATNAPVIDGIEVIAADNYILIGVDGAANLTIQNGGTLATEAGLIGTRLGSAGTVKVSGAESSWRIDGVLEVGSEGQGTLHINNGATVEALNGFLGGSALGLTGNRESAAQIGPADANGSVMVSGGIWRIAESLNVGYAGSGSLNIALGGVVDTKNSYVGAQAGATGAVIVDGPESAWKTQEGLSVGNGTLDVRNGGTVKALYSNVGGIGSAGAVTVHGANSSWSSTHSLFVGENGKGTLDIFDGGMVQAQLSYLGSEVGSTGIATVDGVGSVWNTELGLGVGASGDGTLHVRNGGEAHSGSGALGILASAVGVATIEGGGSSWSIGQDLLVGYRGKGTLYILGGGLVEVQEDGRIGAEVGATGLVVVDGTNARWNVNNSLSVGSSGSGALTIRNGGLVDTANIFIAKEAGSIGSLNIGATEGEAAVAAGSLDAASVEFGAGTGVLNFNHTGNVDGSDVVFNAAISGTGTVNQKGPGTTVLTAANTYTGATTVSGGELRVDGSLIQTGAGVTVTHGGTVSGAGTITSVIVEDGGTLRGVQGQTLTLGEVLLDAGSTVSVALGAAGGSSLFHVNNTFELNGTLQVTDLGGFGAGVYRLFDYDSGLFDNGLEIGTSPAGVPASDLSIQTSVDHQINLISLGGQALNFWDGGDQSLHQNGSVDGGAGTWDNGNANWTVANGAVNSTQRPQPGFAVFQGAAGKVTVDDVAGAVSATGLQFASNGYRLEGDTLALTDAQGVIRVGDGSAASSGYTATIASSLIGTGALVKTDLGTLVLDGENTYAGGTLIRDGALQLGDGGTTGSIAGDVVNDGVLIFNRSDDAVFAGVISGSGHLRQQGSGTTILTGANIYTGGTTIASGLLQVGDGGTTGSLTGNVANTGTLTFNRSDSNTFTGAISGSGGVHQIGVGTTTFTGNQTYTGGTSIEAGTLQIGGGGTTGSLTGEVANAGTLAFNRSNSATFAGSISGSGAVQQRGTGTTTLTGNSTYAGVTTVAAGTLAVDGSIAASSLTTVQVGATLAGTGTVGNTTLQGTLAPGHSIGTLTVNGDYTQTASANYAAELGAGAASDLLHVTGVATLQAGTQLQAQRLPGTTVAAGTRYTVLTADGGLTGRYTLTNDTLSAFLGTSAAYDATHAYLDVSQTRSFASVGQTRNQIATANGAESLGSGQPVFDAALSLADEARARAAFDQLSGEIHASTAGALLEESRTVREAADARLRTVAHEDLAPASWGQVYGAWGRTDSDSNAGEREVGRGGLLLGHDIAMGAARFGVIGGTGRTSVQVDDRQSKANSDSWHLGVYGGTQYGAWGIRGVVAYSGHDVETTRQVRFTGIDQSLRANYDVKTTQAFAEVGYGIEASNARYEPFAKVATINTRNDDFVENGGSAALHGEQSSTRSTFATLGVRAESAFKQGDHAVRLHGTLGWQHGFGDEVPTADLNFAGGDAFTIAGPPIARDTAVLEAGIDLQLGQRASLGVSYSGQLADDAHEHSAQAQLQVKF